jgi:tetratricopeptide (TPR) repeat protein
MTAAQERSNGSALRGSGRWWTAAALALSTTLLFARSAWQPFILFDDVHYLAENPMVLRGLSWSGVRWAFTTFYFGNWHPLTWLSYQLDVQLFGLDAGALHLESALLHGANAALLFLALDRMTGARGRSAAVALLFAVHPLRVESVAWAAERKDVLSTLFGLLALIAYTRYAARPGARRYALVAVSFALSLLAKGMWVTFPLLLLLLDVWPLRRLPRWSAAGDAGAGRFPPVSLRRALLEKLPLLLLSAAASAVTVLAQAQGGAVAGLQLGLGARAANALVAYARYLAKLSWPSGLAVMYPLPLDGYPAWQVAGSAALLAAVGAAATWQLRRRPWLLVGWCWFLGALVPVIGLVQVGAQAMADRYTYLPSIGLTVALVWAAHEALGALARAAAARRLLTAAVALLLAALTWRQLGLWSDQVTLFEHAIAVTGPNSRAQGNLANALRFERRLEAARDHAAEAVRLEPASSFLRLNLALVDVDRGDLAAARDELEVAVRINPRYAIAWSLLGEVRAAQGQLEPARAALLESARLAPEDAGPWVKLGDVYAAFGRAQEAVAAYQRALRVDPDDVDALRQLERASSARR